MTQTETRIFHYDLAGHLIGETNQTGQMLAEYVYLGDQLLSMIKPGESVNYYHNDHLGTPQVLTDDTQTISWKADYTPFGEAVISVETVDNPFRFPGQYYDQETGLHYNYFRYYNPQTGRYITPDPIGLEGGINLFVYVAGNPVNLTDPWGLDPIDPKTGKDNPVTRCHAVTHNDPTENLYGTLIIAGVATGAIWAPEIGGAVYIGGRAVYYAGRGVYYYLALSALQHQKTYQNALDFMSGAFTPGPPPASWSGYAGSSIGLAFDWFTNWPSHEPIRNNYPQELCEQKCH